jgi:crotonobetainyl-CoA:carnitine CoA-transferase CaiB-like acyl-CoA transferase
MSAPGASDRASAPGPLAGLRVVDLAHARAGPTCVRQLADMGADVIQVGSPERADLSGSDMHNLHRGKRSILLDLKSEGGQRVLRALVARADVLVENFRAPVKHRLGIDYETLRALNPRLVYASVSGFGQDGPYAERPGVDQIAQGMGGLMSVTGPPGSGPWRAGIAISDTASGTLLTQGVLAALLVRERTGRGQWVHTSLLEAMIGFMDFQMTRWLIDRVVPGQAGNHHPTVFPMGTYRAADGWLNLAPSMDWAQFARALDAPELLEDARFASAPERARHRDALGSAIEARLAARPVREWVEILSAAGIPAGPVLRVDEVFADPQVQHLEMTAVVEHAVDGPVELVRHPVQFSETPARVRGAAPVPGAHTREVLEELGYAPAEIEGLIASGAAATRSRARPWSLA